jgi:hypothetical protein
MVAGPPKVSAVALCFFLSILVAMGAVFGQDGQSGLLTATDLISVITDAGTLTDAQKEALSESLLETTDSDAFLPGELLSLLLLPEAGSVSLEEVEFVVAALETAFNLLLSGGSDLFTVTDALFEVFEAQDLGVLDRLLQPQAGSSGVANTLSQALLMDAGSLIGVDTPPGQAANRATDQREIRTTHRHQEQAETLNTECNVKPEEVQSSGLPEGR